MRRREFIGLLGGATVWPLTGRAQPAKIARIGFLGAVSATSYASRVEAFRAGLRELGYVEGKNIVIEFRWAEGHYDRLPALAAELVRLNVDVIVAHGAPGALAAQQATSTIPIVITAVADMLSLGLVQSLSHPGGNITGLSFFNSELAAKRLELLKEAVPSLVKAAVLMNPDNQFGTRLVLEALETTATALKVKLQAFEVRGGDDFERPFAEMASQQIGAVVIHEDATLNYSATTIADLAAKYRLPLCGSLEFGVAGGLMAYGVNFPDMDRRAAIFVDKILKGAKPANLPVERSTRFAFRVNLRTAKALGLTIPPTLLARAEEVIE